ncbi:MAG: FGGY-family carbohydrate kinase [Halanaerobiales bacterium]
MWKKNTSYRCQCKRSVFFGLSARQQRSHLSRSAMESKNFGLKDSLELIKDKEDNLSRIRAIGGGVKSQLWQQILVDIFETPIDLLEVEKTSICSSHYCWCWSRCLSEFLKSR